MFIFTYTCPVTDLQVELSTLDQISKHLFIEGGMARPRIARCPACYVQGGTNYAVHYLADLTPAVPVTPHGT